MINLCPICDSASVTVLNGQCHCRDCGSEWVQPPEAFLPPYPFDATVYIVEPSYPAPIPQAVKIVGYELTKHGTFAAVEEEHITRWVRLDRLYPTKEDCERSIHK